MPNRLTRRSRSARRRNTGAYLALEGQRKSYWGTVGQAISRIAAARSAGGAVTADQYPYIASATSLAAMTVPDWAFKEQRPTSFGSPRIAARPRLRTGIEQNLLERDGGSSIRIARYPPRPEWAGLDLASIAGREGVTPLDVVLEIQRHGGARRSASA